MAKALPLAAMRIPERWSERLPLAFPAAAPQLYVHEGARQALERKFQAAMPGHVVLGITDNRHSIISTSRQGAVTRVRLHHMFLDAPPKVMDALVRYLTRGDREASVRVGLYIEENASRLARRKPRKIALHTRGEHHDLMGIAMDVNERYFGGTCTALVTWGRHTRRPGRDPRKTIRLGSYASLERLIRIHPVLDRAWVPRYFIAFVVYHEMLHHMFPAAREGNRRLLHPPEFLEQERLFRPFDRAVEWEKRNIARLLRLR